MGLEETSFCLLYKHLSCSQAVFHQRNKSKVCTLKQRRRLRGRSSDIDPRRFTGMFHLTPEAQVPRPPGSLNGSFQLLVIRWTVFRRYDPDVLSIFNL